jgi:formate hydrogenlyase subunit 3/multisubunit Na+/H+ antiporter MnhD subunit
MELFLAQNHSAMTHLPIATAILIAIAALVTLFVPRKEITWSCAILSLVALVAVVPTVVTGIAAAKGRFNDEGKPYIQSGVIVANIPANTRIFRHQVLGLTGTALAALMAILSIAKVRGRNPNRYLIALVAVLLAVVWGVGGHLGGEELWGAGTFPAFH